jgi:hypothetical protein
LTEATFLKNNRLIFVFRNLKIYSNMKKYLIIVSLFCLSGFTLQAQQTTAVDPRLRQAFPESFIDYMVNEQPGVLRYETWFLDNCYFTETIFLEDNDYMPLFAFNRETNELGAEITEYDAETFNIYLTNAQPDEYTRKYYKIGNSVLLVILSGDEIRVNYNKSLDHEK